MKNTIFTGAATAIITPFKNGEIDYEAYARLIDWQIESGISAIVAAGTTGEGSTLTDDEHKEIIKFTVEHVNGRVPVVAGTGSNCTETAIYLSFEIRSDFLHVVLEALEAVHLVLCDYDSVTAICQ